ncbi:hypothetical protein [Agrobacterium pusense]|uniref:hypothetical protein n=1 Tax=Agrobacterium pusense TaxID=648995 RepID=UPI001AE755BA|nr:hypothetical protein [Agrobacterium pusense]MBP2613047.1 SMC interacting uncharacterized protein involved in chromosome segregation [Agrobacterium pusense]
MTDIVERLKFIAIDNAETLTEDEHATLSEAATILSEADKRVKEARAKALEEAAAVAEEQAEMRERLFNENGTSHNAIRAAQSLIIAERIRALQSEER